MKFDKEQGWHLVAEDGFPEITKRVDDYWGWNSSDVVEFAVSSRKVLFGLFHTWTPHSKDDIGMGWEAVGDPKVYSKVIAWRYIV